MFLVVCQSIALALLGLALLFTIVRLAKGPTLADRIMALDLLTTLAISFIGLAAIWTRVWFDLDIALALCLVGFVSTIALARYLLRRGADAKTSADADSASPGSNP